MTDTTSMLKALGDENRFRIAEMLLKHDLCVKALAERLGISEPAVSQHLKVLREAGLVRGEKRGWFTHYEVDRETLVQLANELEDMAKQPKSICRPDEGCKTRRQRSNSEETP